MVSPPLPPRLVVVYVGILMRLFVGYDANDTGYYRIHVLLFFLLTLDFFRWGCCLRASGRVLPSNQVWPNLSTFYFLVPKKMKKKRMENVEI